MRAPICSLLVITVCGMVLPGAAYDTQLDARAIHDAYVLGQRNDKATGDFLAGYVSQMSEPQNGAHIAEIELLTPYAQIVDQSRQKTAEGYSEDEAAQEYQRGGNTVRVNIVILLPAAYPQTAAPQGGASVGGTGAAPPATGQEKSAMRPENFWQNFQFHLKQHGKTIASRGVSNQPIRSTATNNTPSVLDGESVWLDFDSKDVATEIATVEVITPDAKTIQATFDLKKLR